MGEIEASRPTVETAPLSIAESAIVAFVPAEAELPQPTNQVGKEERAAPVRVIRNQHERSIVSFLSKYPGEPVDRVFTRAMNSRNYKEQELIYGLMLGAFPVEVGIENAKQQLIDSAMNGRDVAAANFFEAHGSNEDIDWLQEAASTFAFPDGFGVAMTLERLGQPASMQLWCDAAEEACSGTLGISRLVLRCCSTYSSERTTKLLQTLESSSFDEIATRAKALLGITDDGATMGQSDLAPGANPHER
ncbi:MAG: hypothetical protein ACKVX7_04255 [Planctomycetota bacterium]